MPSVEAKQKRVCLFGRKRERVCVFMTGVCFWEEFDSKGVGAWEQSDVFLVCVFFPFYFPYFPVFPLLTFALLHLYTSWLFCLETLSRSGVLTPPVSKMGCRAMPGKGATKDLDLSSLSSRNVFSCLCLLLAVSITLC